MIFTHVPYRLDANLGRAYNEFLELLPADAWACFLDHDAMPTTGQWFRQLTEAIAFKPDAGAFVAMANRMASPWQRPHDVPTNNNDMAWHRQKGAERAAKVRTLLDISDTKGFGGVMFAISKTAWAETPGFADGLGCVDHSMHFALQKTGRRVYLLEGLYVFHWRHHGEADPTSMHPKAANCPCRGLETLPTERILIP